MVSDVRCIGVSDGRQHFDSRRESAHSETITSHPFVRESVPTTDDLALPKTIVSGAAGATTAHRVPNTFAVRGFRQTYSDRAPG